MRTLSGCCRKRSLSLCLVIAAALPVNADDLTTSLAYNSKTNSAELARFKEMSLQELMNQKVTSVAREPQPYAEAPAAIQVITADDIHRFGASSIPEALRLADNLDIEQAGSSSWNISARGFNRSGFSDKLLVLIDGRSVYTPLLAGVVWNMQDVLLEDVDRIEVISGPGGTLWGANAVNGVINIITKSTRDTQGLYVEGGGGSWLRDFGGLQYGGTLASTVYYRVYGKYFDRGSEEFPDGTSAHDSWNRAQGGFRLDAYPSWNNQLTLQGDIFGGDTDVTLGNTEGNPNAEGTTSGGNVLGRWTHTFEEDSVASLQLYYDRSHLSGPFQSFPALGVPAGTLFDDLDTVDLDFQDRFPLGERNHIVWGLGYRFTHDFVQAAPLVGFEPPILEHHLFSGFVQEQFDIRDNLFFIFGTKIEHNDYTGFEEEPNVRLQWNFTPKQMVWGAVSRAVRMPSRYDRDLFEPSPGFFNFLGVSNSTFQSESLIAYEVGYRAGLGKRVTTSISAFYNDYNNLRSLSLTDRTNLPAFWANNLKGETYGFELTADYQILDWWRLHAGYDFLMENIYVKPGQMDVNNALDETADPEHQVFLRSSMDLPHNVELAATGRWISSSRYNNGGTAATVPDYFELGARLAWRPMKDLELSVVGENLLRAKHIESGAAAPATPIEIERSVYGEMTWRW